MVIYCFVPDCKSFGTNGFHSYPANLDRRQKWMNATKTTHLGPFECQKICRKHFKECDLITDIDGKKRLVGSAIPSLFLPGSSTLDGDHSYALVNKVYRILKKCIVELTR